MMTNTRTDISPTPSKSCVLSPDSRIFIAGHQGMVGSAIFRHLQDKNYINLITRSHEELDLLDQSAVRNFFQDEKIDAVVLAAAKVGGIQANSSYPAEFIFQNLMIQTNVIHEAYRSGVERLLFLGSSCIYPKYAQQPMGEELLLTGLLEPTNAPYAVAKIAGIKLCESYNRQYGTHYRAIMPTNLYGPNDNFDIENSHVLPAMIRKFHLAKLANQKQWEGVRQDQARFGPIPADFESRLKSLALANSADSKSGAAVRLWGSGRPRREFLHVDDLASASLFLLNLADRDFEAACTVSSRPVGQSVPKESCDSPRHRSDDQKRVSHINVGSGKDIMIKNLSETVQKIVGYAGDVEWDDSMPDGTPLKLLDISRLARLGWKPGIGLVEGIKSTYEWYLVQTGFA